MKMTLRQLSLFQCVARHMSYTRAAEQMHLTQPAVSIQLKQLEEHLGMPLFEQVGKRLFLTQAGEELQAACGDIFSRLENLEMALTRMRGVMQGQLKIASVSSAKYFVPHLLGEFHRQYPQINLSLQVSNRGQILRRLSNNEDDLALMAQVPEDMKLLSYPIIDNPMIAIASPGHPLVGEGKLPLNVLERESFLMREPGSGSRKAIEDHLKNHGVELGQTMELGSSETIKQGVMAGLGLSVISRHSVALELATGCLVALDLETLPMLWTWCLVHHREKKLSPAAEAFLEYVLSHREAVRELIDNLFLDATLPQSGLSAKAVP